MMHRLFPVIFLLLGFAPGARAQVNIEKLRVFTGDGAQLTFDGDVVLQSGNAELYEVGLGTRLDVRRAEHYAFLIGSVRYGERGEKAFKNRAFAHLRYTHTFSDPVRGEAFTQVEHDGFTLLNLRSLVGLGLRLRYYEAESFSLYQGTALMPEHEELQADRVEVHPASTTTLRWSNYLNIRLAVSDAVSFSNTFYFQPRLDDFGDTRILDDAVLAFKITEGLTFSTAFNLRYDSRPPDGIGAFDLSLRNAISLTLQKRDE